MANICAFKGVNISSFPVPPGLYISNKTIADPYYTTTTYDISWASNSNFSQALGGDHNPFCYYVATAIDYPVNVTNKYTDEQANSTDCSPVLGKTCVDAIVAKAKSSIRGAEWCQSPGYWAETPECADTLGYTVHAAGSFGAGGTGYNLTNTTAQSLEKGDGFFGYWSQEESGSNRTRYLMESNQLQILMFYGLFPTEDNAQTGGGQAVAQLLCTRVNTTKLSDSSDLNKDGVTLTSEALFAYTSGSAPAASIPTSLLMAGLAIVSGFGLLQL